MKCYGHSLSTGFTCPTGKYWHQPGADIGSDAVAACCTAKATCEEFQTAGTSCGPGMKVKATLTGLTCTTSATNSADTCTACCEADTTICDAWGLGPLLVFRSLALLASSGIQAKLALRRSVTHT